MQHTPNILVLSAYDTPSHKYWREGIVSRFPHINFTSLCLTPKFFSWRIKGNPLNFIHQYSDELSKEYNAILATSMVDIATLRGLYPHLSCAFTIVYFHENQFAYPVTSHQRSLVDAQVTSIYSALCADKVCFNSQFNFDSFSDGAQALLKKLPDGVPKNILQKIQCKAEVLPVPLVLNSSMHRFDDVNEVDNTLHVVWNHRWEYDKCPERLLSIIQQLPRELNVKFSILGQRFRQEPSAFQKIQHCLMQRGWLEHFGYIECKSDYYSILSQADVVLSTALHDFQGLSVLEAVACGCVPVIPNRVAYPEHFSHHYLYYSSLDDTDSEVSHETSMATAKLIDYSKIKERGDLLLVPDVSKFSWDSLLSAYLVLLGGIGDSKSPVN